MKRLSELSDGDVAIIKKIHSSGEYSKRLTEMGFIKGRRVVAVKNAPLKDPIEYELMGYSISLRRREAFQIEVVMESELNDEMADMLPDQEFSHQSSSDFGAHSERSGRTIKVALIGNPNCGKTTLFNTISGLDEHVGNYSGVTVELKQATIRHRGYNIDITDLPGTYSLSTYSPEERIVRDELERDKYDFIVNVVDATLLERNLYLTTQMMDMACHIIVSLNMYDELEALGDEFDHTQMAKMLDIPFIPTIARRGVGVDKLLDMVVSKFENEYPHTHVESNFGLFIEERLSELSRELEGLKIKEELPRRYLALSLVGGGDAELRAAVDQPTRELCDRFRREIEVEYGDKIDQALADSRYGYIAGALKETLTVNSARFKQSQAIDNILTHKFLGFPIFLALIWLMFYVTFTVGSYPMDWIDMGVGALSDWLSEVMSDGALKDLVIDGIIGGVGGVIIFLPNILLLFLFISVLEDSGYMARAAFIMDRMMHKVGLHGKSFVPLIMGFGCNVPAIMASRIIEDRNNRLLTLLIVPFMSCSARLPVYILIVGAFFPASASWVLFGIYLFGVALAILTAVIFKRFMFSGEDHPFVMELPPYRLPMASNTLKHMWHKGSQYLKKMGGIILVGAVIIWALGYYPTRQDSYLERIGHTIEPAIAPLGFDWKIGVSLVSGVAAKEIVVSTMGVLYNIEESEDEEQLDSLIADKMRSDRYSSGKRAGELVFTTPTVLSFLAFVLIYLPCLAVIAAIKRESGSWRWALFSVLYTTGLAWVVSFLIYNIGTFLIA
ncbi:MAG: ferrous iron transport protein B [Rikenellaceae bacterium]